ncbi:MAG: hypothetical protein AAB318_05775, partial [Planctomycetota bacterium]
MHKCLTRPRGRPEKKFLGKNGVEIRAKIGQLVWVSGFFFQVVGFGFFLRFLEILEGGKGFFAFGMLV